MLHMINLTNMLIKDMKNYYIEYNGNNPKNNDDVLRFMYSHASLVIESMDMIKRYDQYDIISVKDYPLFIQHLFEESLLTHNRMGVIEDMTNIKLSSQYDDLISICNHLNAIELVQDSASGGTGNKIITFSDFKRQFKEYWEAL